MPLFHHFLGVSDMAGVIYDDKGKPINDSNPLPVKVIETIPAEHDHDDRYYTKAEVDQLLDDLRTELGGGS